jgi:hypothetical protein
MNPAGKMCNDDDDDNGAQAVLCSKPPAGKMV